MKFEISDEFLLQWSGLGFKMIVPEISSSKYPPLGFIKSIKDFMDIAPVNFYIKNLHHELQLANETLAITHGLSSFKEIKGKTVEKVFKQETVSYLHRFDDIILQNQKFDNRELNTYLKNDLVSFSVDYKFPLYNLSGILIGIVGMALMTGDTSIVPLAVSIQSLADFGILELLKKKANIHFMERKINNIYFSQREWDCLPFLARGASAKNIAKSLNISNRTVEQYIASIKAKLNVSSKQELIYVLQEI